MGFLYGNITNHLPRTNFPPFYKIYPTRKEMHEEVEVIAKEGEDIEVDIGEYLLIDYSLKSYNDQNRTYIQNQEIDENEYGMGSFDSTVWQVQLVKVDKDELARCIAIDRLHSVLPTFEQHGHVTIDILEPLSGSDYFGRGKNIWSINSDGFPISKQET